MAQRNPRVVKRDIENKVCEIARVGFFEFPHQIPVDEQKVPHHSVKTGSMGIDYGTTVGDIIERVKNSTLDENATIEYGRFEGVYIQGWRDQTNDEYYATVLEYQKSTFRYWKMGYDKLLEEKEKLEAELVRAEAHYASLKPTDEERELLRMAKRLGFEVTKVK